MNQNELVEHIVELGLLNSTNVQITPLSGGVSCEIFLLETPDTRFVVKRALDKLKVREDWFADVRRNVTEQKYIRYVGGFLPGAVPQILHSDAERCFFCMEMLDGDLQNWKSRLLNGVYEGEQARRAGEYLGRIHRHSHNDAFVRAEFATLDDFQALRLSPYLLSTGDRHPELRDYFYRESERIAAEARCLVHGDFSPKNLLVSPDRFVILDCEVAWYGDPVFDIAFFLNHFLLKALRCPPDAARLLQLARIAWCAYTEYAGIVVDPGFASRLVDLLPMLMLARVDGKSPVEYLGEREQQCVRRFAYQRIPVTPSSLDDFLRDWHEVLISAKEPAAHAH